MAILHQLLNILRLKGRYPVMATKYVNVGVGQTVRLRSTPDASTTNNILDNLKHGTKVEATKYNDTWDKISSPRNGYMQSSYLSTKDPGSSGTGGTATSGIITGDRVNVRRGPNTTEKSIAQLNKGAKITYYAGKTYSGGGYSWYRCTGTQWSGDGYIATNYVAKASGNTPLPGVTGDGPNSTVSAQDIRDGIGIWVQDVKTKHPQISRLQMRLNQATKSWPDVGTLETDGVFGENTAYVVRWYQAFPSEPTLKVTGTVDRDTIEKIEAKIGSVE